MSNYLLHSIVPREIKKLRLSERLNVVRAGVLGANDGIISVAGIVTGVAGAQQSQMTLFISGLAGMFAGAYQWAEANMSRLVLKEIPKEIWLNCKKK